MDKGDVTIEAPAAAVRAVAMAPSIKISTSIWGVWWRLAREHTEASRAEVEKGGETLEGVMDHAMIAIVASASALGGFAASLRREVSGADLHFAKGTPPEKKILETAKVAAKVGGRANGLLVELRWLFDLRDPLVHPGEALREPVAHPDRPGVGVSVESASYSATNAERALGLVVEIVRLCRDEAKPAAREFFERRETSISRHLGEQVDP